MWKGILPVSAQLTSIDSKGRIIAQQRVRAVPALVGTVQAKGKEPLIEGELPVFICGDEQFHACWKAVPLSTLLMSL